MHNSFQTLEHFLVLTAVDSERARGNLEVLGSPGFLPKNLAKSIVKMEEEQLLPSLTPEETPQGDEG